MSGVEGKKGGFVGRGGERGGGGDGVVFQDARLVRRCRGADGLWGDDDARHECGSCGLRGQMAHFAILGVGWEDS